MNRLYRWIFCTLGLFLIATGITLAIRSGLGTSALAVLPYTLSRASGIEMGVCSFIFFTLLVLLQMPILGRDFKPAILLQIPFGMLYSAFLTLTGRLYAFTLPDIYWLRLLTLLLSLAICALGVYLYMEPNIILNAPEGFQKTVAQRYHLSVPKVKMGVDCAFVILAALIGLILANRIVGIREGTLLSAVVTGRLIGFIPGSFKRRIHGLCYTPPGRK